jgi:hypothetical protein
MPEVSVPLLVAQEYSANQHNDTQQNSVWQNGIVLNVVLFGFPAKIS